MLFQSSTISAHCCCFTPVAETFVLSLRTESIRQLGSHLSHISGGSDAEPCGTKHCRLRGFSSAFNRRTSFAAKVLAEVRDTKPQGPVEKHV